jgi:hypothetical protein
VTLDLAGVTSYVFPQVVASLRLTALSNRWYYQIQNEDEFRAGAPVDEASFELFSIGPGETLAFPVECRRLWLGANPVNAALPAVLQIDGWS